MVVRAGSDRYSNLDFKPPKNVANEAARGLDLRSANNGQGGTAVGVARARDLSNRKNVSPETVRRMKAFFDRHAKNKTANPGTDLEKDKGYIAHLLWGGDPGQKWAEDMVKKMDAADAEAEVSACGQAPSEMTLRNLEQILLDVATLSVQIAPESVLDGWAEDLISQAKTHLQTVANYMKTNNVSATKAPWKEPNPPGGKKLTEEWKARARERAKAAGRRYPNQVDNMWAMQQQSKADVSASAAIAEAVELLRRDS